MSDLRALIREILIEEISAVRAAPSVRQEQVSICNDADLTQFVTRLMEMAQDSHLRNEIAAGRYVFQLGDSGAQPIQAHQPMALPPTTTTPTMVVFEQGLIGEREVSKLPQEQRAISVGANVRFTPLARDELRRRSIKIERKST